MATEVADEVLAGVIRDDALVALDLHELDVVEHVLEGVVVFSQCAEGLVEHATVGLSGITKLALEVGPTGAFGTKKVS